MVAGCRGCNTKKEAGPSFPSLLEHPQTHHVFSGALCGLLLLLLVAAGFSTLGAAFGFGAGLGALGAGACSRAVVVGVVVVALLVKYTNKYVFFLKRAGGTEQAVCCHQRPRLYLVLTTNKHLLRLSHTHMPRLMLTYIKTHIHQH